MNIESYLEKIEQEIPNFFYEDLEYFNDGRNHDVLLFDKKRVFRFDRENNSVEREHELLNYLSEKISCRIPDSVYLSCDTTWNEENYITGEKIRYITDVSQGEILSHIALFLKELHQTSRQELSSLGFVRDDDNSGYVRHMKEQTMMYLNEYIDGNLRNDIFGFIERAFGYVHPHPCLIHGDVNGKNVYWDKTLDPGKELGVIDFEDATIFDPAKDFCYFGRKYGNEALEHMLDVYGIPDEGFIKRVDMHYKRARLHVCINHIEKNRKRTSTEVVEELKELFSGFSS